MKLEQQKRRSCFRSITFPINEHHDQIKRQILNFLKIYQSVLEVSSRNFIFQFQISVKADLTNWFRDYSNERYKIDIKTI